MAPLSGSGSGSLVRLPSKLSAGLASSVDAPGAQESTSQPTLMVGGRLQFLLALGRRLQSLKTHTSAPVRLQDGGLLFSVYIQDGSHSLLWPNLQSL